MRTAFATYAAFFAVSLIVSLWVYRSALHGQFISDDHMFVAGNPYVLNPGSGFLSELFVPGGHLQTIAGGHYTPVPMLAYLAEARIFGLEPFPFHIVNVLLHAVNTTLLAAAFCVTGISRRAALVGAALFGDWESIHSSTMSS